VTLQNLLRKSLPAVTGIVEEFLKLMEEVPQTKVLVLKPGETVQ